jgi:hypothetical protein
MPCLPISSGLVAGGLMPAGQSVAAVWLRLALSAVAGLRSHLISHWFPGLFMVRPMPSAYPSSHMTFGFTLVMTAMVRCAPAGC